jgi:hypothetical protein
MLKVSFFQGEDEHGQHVLPIFGPGSTAFEKNASSLLPDVQRFIETLRPQKDAQYVLVNALAAGEYFGSNINGDFFPEAALIHAPDTWKGVPVYDQVTAKSWPYGHPTFYKAHAYAHHRNKDASRAFGNVELTTWNNAMKRVELVVRVDKERCYQFGAVSVWDKLHAGQYVDVSMGCRVPFDTCSICLDWDAYRKGQASFDAKKHKHPGDAVLAYHKELKTKRGHGIRGLSITRADYCEHALRQMNKILPDGRKVFVYNDYPSFFDISFVFIGADKTAKVMLHLGPMAKVAADNTVFYSLPNSAEMAERLGYEEKVASVDHAGLHDHLFKAAFLGKTAKNKESEITKDVFPSQFAGKAVPIITNSERDLTDEALEGIACCTHGVETAASLGIVLRPKEFQRVMLVRLGLRPEAEELEQRDVIFPESTDSEKFELASGGFSRALASILRHFIDERSAFGPAVERRALSVGHRPEKKVKEATSLSSPLLCKIGAAYNGYRQSLMDHVAYAQSNLQLASSEATLQKLALARTDEIFTPLSVAYLKLAFLNEIPSRGIKTATSVAGVERGFPLEEHVGRNRNPFMGGPGR